MNSFLRILAFSFLGFLGVPLLGQPTDYVAYYPFSGDATDQSGNAYNATNNGASLIADRFGNANSAYEFYPTSGFNGDNMTVEATSDLQPGTAITISFWANTYAYENTAIVGKRANELSAPYNSYVMAPSGSVSGAYFAISTDQGSFGAQDPDPLALNEWHHYVGTYDGTHVKIYIDGVLKDSQSATGSITYTSLPLRIGKAGSGNYTYSGAVDDVKIYSRALSEQEIQSLYATDVVAFYPEKSWRHYYYDWAGSKDYPFSNSVSTNNFSESWAKAIAFSNHNLFVANVRGNDDLEVVLAQGSNLYLLDNNGNLTTKVLAVSAGAQATLVADVDADGYDEILFGDIGAAHKFHITDSTGTILKTFNYSSGTSGDVLPILYKDGKIYSTHNTGFSLTPRGIARFDYSTGTMDWSYETGPTTSIPSIADMDGDGKLEFALYSQTTHNGKSVNGTTDGDTYTIIVDEDGNNELTTIFPASADGGLTNIFAKPTSTSDYQVYNFSYHGGPNAGTSRVRSIDLSGNQLGIYTGTNLYGMDWAISDLDNDGTIEIIASDRGSTSQSSTLLILDNELNLIRSKSFTNQILIQFTADINGDNSKEIAVTSEGDNAFMILDQNLNTLFTWNNSYGTIKQAIITDFENDDELEIVIRTSTHVVNLINAGLSSGLSAHYTFDGDATDQSGNGNDGTPNGGVAFTTDRFGNANSAASFDGVDDYVELVSSSNQIGINEDISVSMWVEIADFNRAVILLSNYDGGTFSESGDFYFAWSPHVDSIINIQFGQGVLKGIKYESENPVAITNGFHHFAFSMDKSLISNKIKVWIDGGEVIMRPLGTTPNGGEGDGGAIFQTTDPLIAGRHFIDQEYFQGLLDDIRIYNRALIESEIIDLYQSGGWDVTNINTFSLAEQTLDAVIDTAANTVNIEVAYGTDVTTLVPTFSLSVGATAKVGTTDQMSASTANNFTSPVTYTITKLNGATEDWTVTVTVDDGLVAYYPFNGDATDQSGNGNDGTENGGLTYTTDRFGNANSAAIFDGVNDGIDFTNQSYLSPGTTAFSVNVWVKYSTNAVGQRIFDINSSSGEDVPWIQMNGDSNLDEIRFGLKSGGNPTQTEAVATGIKDDNWHMITGVRSSQTDVSIYLDGGLIETNSNPNLGDVNTNIGGYVMRIGYNPGYGGTYNDGMIDDIRIYNRALSEQEVSELYGENNYHPGFEEVGSSLTPIGYATLAIGDVDNNGTIDVLLNGRNSSNKNHFDLYINDGTSFAAQDILNGSVTDFDSNRPAIKIGDITNDQYLDLILGFNFDIARLYRNNNGTYSSYEGINSEGSNSLYRGSIDFGDIDSDGKLELLLTGGGNTRLFKLENDFLIEMAHNLVDVSASQAEFGDLDNDGDLDLIIAGVVSGGGKICKVFENKGNGFSEKTNTGLIINDFDGDIELSDLDNDGDLDLILGMNNVFVYENDNFTFTEIGYLGVDVYEGDIFIGDFDNNGFPDIGVTGSSNSDVFMNYMTSEAYNHPYFLNTYNYRRSVGGVADIDSDNDLDIILCGEEGSPTNPQSRILKNQSLTPNTAPQSPTNLQTTIQLNGDVNFIWDAATDAQTSSLGLSYDIFVGDQSSVYNLTPGKSDPASGFRRIVERGSLQTTFWNMRGLENGTYYWSVQAVDAGYMGSPFATEGTFTVDIDRIVFNSPERYPTSATLSWAAITGADSYEVDVATDADFASKVMGFDAFSTTNTSVSVTGLEDTTTYYYRVRYQIGEEYSPYTSDEFSTTPGFREVLEGQLEGVFGSSVSWGDYDGDGDLDILISGYSVSGRLSKIYENTENGFVEIFSGQLEGVGGGKVAWGDYDRDGDLDILLTGYDNENSNQRLSKIYENTGDAFSEVYINQLEGVYEGSINWGDYDNDGDFDILLAGNSNSSGIISKVYENRGIDFTEIFVGQLEGVTNSSTSLGDYDGDGDLDILLAGSTNSGSQISKVYKNTNNGFIETFANQLEGVVNCSLSWGDYDGDGDLDIFLTGLAGQRVSKIYKNTIEGFIEVFTDQLFGVHYGSSSSGDFDGDGDLDILLTGSDNSNNTISKIYENSGSGFTEVFFDQLTGVQNSSVAWGDYDGDGDLDILLTGINGDNDTEYISKIYENLSSVANTAPVAPANLQTTISLDGTVSFSWDAATDGQTPSLGLSYDIYVGTETGVYNRTPGKADPATGYRRIVERGSLQTTFWNMKGLENGTYYWSVQAVDAGYMGSPFATEGTFTVNIDRIVYNTPTLGPTDANLSWSAISGADSYEIDVAADAAFDSLLTNYNAVSQTTTTLNVSGLNDLTTYYCRARYKMGTDYSPYTEGSFTTVATFVEVYAGQLTGLEYSKAIWGDYDGDGDLDFFNSGDNGTTYVANVYQNTGSGFTKTTILNNLSNPIFGADWGDFDQDGDLDLLLINPTELGDGSGYPIIFQNSDGVFSAYHRIAEYQSSDTDMEWGDVDNDGDLDVVIFNYYDNYFLINEDGAFSKQSIFSINDVLIQLSNFPSLDLADQNKDGQLDFLISGYDNLNTKRITKLFHRNSSDYSEVFQNQFSGNGYGESRFGDFNTDGHLDVLTSGDNYTKIYTFNGSTYAELQQLGYSNYGFADWADVTNNGIYELLEGRRNDSLTIYQFNATNYTKDYSGQLRILLNSSGSHDGEFGDYDGDGDLDILISGQALDAGGNAIRITKIFQNQSTTPNNAPAIPSNLTTSIGTNGKITFSWDQATDTETPAVALQYDMYIGTSSGSGDIRHPHAILSTGQATLPEQGPIRGTSWFINDLPNGTYYWSVQSVDGGLRRSPFATEGTFTVNVTAPATPVATVATNVTSTSFTANWTLETNVAKYTVELDTATSFSTSSKKEVELREVSSYAFTGLRSGTIYYYRLKASNGGGETAYSNAIRVGQSVTLTEISSNRGFPGDTLTLTGTGFESYLPYNVVKLGTLTASVIEVNASGTKLKFVVPTGTQDDVVVSADILGSTASLSGSFLLTSLNRPTALTVTKGTNVELNWAPVVDAEGYSIYRGTSLTSMSIQGSVSTPSFNQATPAAVGLYYYQVTALDASLGESAFSDPVSIAVIGTSGTNVSGNLIESETWTITNSPYNIVGDVGVPIGIVLTIEPGVVINYKGDYRISVRGNILVQGTEFAPILFNGFTTEGTDYMLELRSLNLANVQLEYAHFTGPQKALKIGENDDATDISENLVLEGAKFLNTKISGEDNTNPKSVVYWNESFFNNSDINAEDRNLIYVFDQSELNDLYLNTDSIQILNTRILSCSIGNGNNLIYSVGSQYYNSLVQVYHLKFLNNFISGSQFAFSGSGNGVFTNNAFLFYDLCEFGSDSILLSSGAVTLSGNQFYGASTFTAIGSFGNSSPVGIDITSNTFDGFSIILDVWNTDDLQEFYLYENNFLNKNEYVIYNNSTKNIFARENYWNTNSASVIATKIYDSGDNLDLGTVDFSNRLSTPNLDAPVIAPASVIKSTSGSGISLTWPASQSTDVVGYKLYHGTFNGYEFSKVTDLGNVLTHTLSSGSIEDVYAISAYDAGADNYQDMVEGFESVYRVAVGPPVAPTNLTSMEITTSGFTASWDVILDATGYRLDVSELEDFSTFVEGYNNKAVAGTSTTITGLKANTVYFWQARSENAASASTNSTVSQIKTNLFEEVYIGQLTGVYQSSTAWGDYDGDGYLDILLTGYDNSLNTTSKIYRNSGSGFTEVFLDQLIGVISGGVDWGDYDGDGDLDILLTGSNNSGSFSKIFENNSTEFTEVYSGQLANVQHSSTAWGDFDLDGDLDILLTGYENTLNFYRSKIYENSGSGFDDVFSGQLSGVYYSSADWGDYDGDGDLDVLLSGSGNSGYASKIYENKESGFTEVFSGQLVDVYRSSVVWGDYDGDGDLDILITGNSNSGSICKIYKNHNSEFSEVFSGNLTGLENGSAVWGDYDGDGDLDILLAGSGGPGEAISIIYENTEDDFKEVFSDQLVKVSDGDVAWGDYDGDGDLDILISGGSNSGYISKIYENKSLNPNQSPSQITSPTSEVTGSKVNFSWTAPADDTTPELGLNYNIYIGTTPGKQDIRPAHADVATGFRRIVERGDIQGTSWFIQNLAPGTYYWGVQAIDAGYAGGAFSAEQSFTIESNAIPEFSATSLDFGELVNGDETTRKFSIKNIGTIDLTIASVSYPTGFSGDFTSGSIAPGAIDTITVTFSPTSEQNYSGRITIVSNQTSGPDGIDVIGAGAGAIRYEVTYHPSSLDFGNVDITATSTKSSYLVNTGNKQLQDLNFTFDNGISFSENQSYISAIQPGDSAQIQITFDPGTTGQLDDRYYIYSASVDLGQIGGSLELPMTGFGFDPTIPTAPQSLTQTDLTYNSVTYTWDAVSQAAQYEYQLATDQTFESIVVSSSTLDQPTLNLADLTERTDYYFRVRGINSDAVAGPWTEIMFTTPPQDPFSPLASPAFDLELDGFTVKWTTIAGISGYEVDIARDQEFVDLVSGYTALNLGLDTFLVASGLEANTTYYIRVRSDIDGSTYSGYSNVVMAKTAKLPDAPTNLTISNLQASSFTISWSASLDATGYRVDVSTDSDFSSFVSNLENVAINTTTFNASGLAGNTQYFVRVRSENEYGVSDSETLNLKTLLFEEAYTGQIQMSGYYKQIVPGDMNGDGRMDLMISGYSSFVGEEGSYLFENTDEGFVFSNLNDQLPKYNRATSALGDYDGDGDLDLILTGEVSGTNEGRTRFYANESGFTQIFNGVLPNIKFGGLTRFGDMDNDGDMDIFLNGYEENYITQIYDFSSDQYIFGTDLPGSHGNGISVDLGDFDLDGDLDLIQMSQFNNSNLLENNSNGFEVINISNSSLYQGNARWADFDQDGDLDLLLMGRTGSGSRSTTVYRNNGSEFNSVFNSDLIQIGEGFGDWGDVDQDGAPELILSGRDGDDNYYFLIYQYTGSGFEVLTVHDIPGVLYSTFALFDVENDGDLDLMVFGDSNNGSISRIYLNQTGISNMPPAQIINPVASITGGKVTFNWEAPSDDTTPSLGLNYNIYIGTAPGKQDIRPAHADVATGFRRIVERGDIQPAPTGSGGASWYIQNLAPGTYYWGVQAIDAGYTGGAFSAEQSFTIESNAIPEFSATSLDFGELVNGDQSTRKFSIKNIGTIDLIISAVTYPSGFTGNYTSGTLAPGDIDTVTVTFSPTAAQDYTGRIIIGSNKTSGPDGIDIIGKGAGTARYEMGYNPTSLDFGSVNITTPSTKSFYLINKGNKAITFFFPSISGNNSTEFALQNYNSPLLSPKDSVLIQIRFTPASVGTKSASILFSNTTPSSSQISGSNVPLTLTGFGFDPSVPLAPQNLTASSVQFDRVTLSWDVTSQATTYEVQIATDNQFASDVITRTGIATATVEIDGLSEKTSYFARVRGINNTSVSGPYSVAISIITPAEDPFSPTLFNAYDIGTEAFSINWSRVNGIQNYELDIATDDSFLLGVTGYFQLNVGTDTSVVVTGLAPGMTYYVRVRSNIDGSTYSGYSNINEIQTNDIFREVGSISSLDFSLFNSFDLFDFDQDNDLDVLPNLTSLNTSTWYENQGNGTLSQVSALYTISNVFDWVDFDGDGDLDAITYVSQGKELAVWKNTTGNFVKIFSHTIAEDWRTPDNSFNTKLGDFDNDGDNDIMIFGPSDLIRLFRNMGNNEFEWYDFEPNIQQVGDEFEWVDLDNDADLDLVFIGEFEQRIYRNDGSGNFNLISQGYEDLFWGVIGEMSINDINQDGFMDISVLGIHRTNSDGPYTGVWINNQNMTFTDIAKNLPDIDRNGSLKWIDFNNDGLLEIYLNGEDNLNVPINAFYTYLSGESFEKTTFSSLEGNQGQQTWGDFDKDGDLDLLLGVKYFENNISTSNLSPTQVQNPSVVDEGSKVTFTWSAATDDHTSSLGLTYNIYIGTSPGKQDIRSAHANLNSGRRWIVERGKIQGTSWYLQGLPAGTYYWGVQAIDANFEGGAFSSEQSFRIFKVAASPATEITINSFKANWQIVDDVMGYYLDVALDQTFTTFLSGYQNLDVGNLTSYEVTDLTDNTTYYYRVRSKIDDASSSASSNVVSVTTVLAPPAVPVLGSVSAIKYRQATLNWEAAPNVDGYLLDVAEDEGFSVIKESFTVADPSLVIEDLNPSTTYFYRVKAYNLAGPGVSVTSSFTTLDDVVSPTIITNSTLSEVLPSDLTVSAVATDDDRLTKVNFYKSSALAFNWSKAETTDITSSFVGSISVSDFDEIGVSYFFEAIDVSGNNAFSDTLTIRTLFPPSFEVVIPELNTGTDVTDYQLFAFPFKSASVATVLSDLGGAKNTSWRLFKYSNGYQEFPSFNDLDPGVGYWLIVDQKQTSISLNGALVPVESPYSVTLTNGWNLIGNPYPSTILWSEVVASSGFSAGDISSLIIWDNGYQTSGTLDAFEGGFVFANQPNLVLKFPISSISGSRLPNQSGMANAAIEREGGWEVVLDLQAGGLNYSAGGFGVHPKASLAKDRYDMPELIHFSKYLKLSHTEGLSISIQPEEDLNVWEFSVLKNSKELVLGNITFNMTTLPSDLRIVLIDDETQTVIEVVEDGRYDFNLSKTHSFIAISGGFTAVEDYLNQRSGFIGDIYPNPTNGLVNVSVHSNNMEIGNEVKFELLDLTGRSIEVQSQSIQSGTQLLKFSPKRLPESGIYFLRIVMQSGEETIEKKVKLYYE